jgi:hypothetical protein
MQYTTLKMKHTHLNINLYNIVEKTILNFRKIEW